MMEELMQCKLCGKRLQNHRMLSCQHTFCQSCLQALVHPASEGKRSSQMFIVAIWCLVGACRLTALMLWAVASLLVGWATYSLRSPLFCDFTQHRLPFPYRRFRTDYQPNLQRSCSPRRYVVLKRLETSISNWQSALRNIP